MERLTEKRRGQNVIPLRHEFSLVTAWDNVSFLYGDAADKLAAYEDTGLTPKGIEALKADNDRLHELIDETENLHAKSGRGE